METYFFGVTNAMLIGHKSDKGNFGTFNNSIGAYAVAQACQEYPNHIVEKMDYEFLPDKEPEEGGQHNWLITLKSYDEFVK